MEKEYQGLDKFFSSNNDNKKGNESLFKKEDVAKTLKNIYIIRKI